MGWVLREEESVLWCQAKEQVERANGAACLRCVLGL